jgi:rhodanese-related sulfurtransferase
MKILNKEQLEKKLESGDAVLLNVLPREKYAKQHIPGSSNVPVSAEDFIRQAEKKIENLNQDVIVYCASFDCDASTQAAEKLEKAGYKRVYDFKGGMKEWSDEGGDIASLSQGSGKGMGEASASL